MIGSGSGEEESIKASAEPTWNGKEANSKEVHVEQVEVEDSGAVGKTKNEEQTLEQDAPPWLFRLRERTGFGKKLLMPYLGLGIMNVIVMILLFALFVFNAVTIIDTYKKSQGNPPSTVSTTDESASLRFPSMLLCSTITETPMEIIFGPVLDSDEPVGRMVGPQPMPPFGDSCAFFDFSSVKAYEGVVVDESVFLQSNVITLLVDINATNASTYDTHLGVDVYMIQEFEERYGDFFEATLEPWLSPDGYSLASTGVYTDMSFTQTKYALYGQEVYFDLDVNSGTARINPKAARSDGLDEASVVVLGFSFSNPNTRLISSEPQTFSALFGSLAGWLGACSDGWGLLSVVFFVEKLVLRLCGKYREQLWTLRADAQFQHRVAGI